MDDLKPKKSVCLPLAQSLSSNSFWTGVFEGMGLALLLF